MYETHPYPEILRLKGYSLDKNLAHFLEDGAKVKTLSEIKLPLLHSTTCIQNQGKQIETKEGTYVFRFDLNRFNLFSPSAYYVR